MTMKRTIKQTCQRIAAAINAQNLDLAKQLVEQVTYAGALPTDLHYAQPRTSQRSERAQPTRSTYL